ncbi:MAG: MCE family protein [Verrucomicrobia bacterium]|nr:MCE family protein [Verrucomicrobiota bacterium]
MKNSLETRLGVFFALVVIAAIIILEIAGGTDLLKRGYQLRGHFKSAQELKIGDAVKMAGVKIGRVEKIGFADDMVEVTMKIDRGIEVRTDSRAAIKFGGLMGQNFVFINLGSPKAPKFTDGQLIQTYEQADLSTLMAKLDNVASGIENVTKSFSGDSLQNILGPFTDFLKQNQTKLTALFGNMQNISDQIAQGKGTVGKLISDEALYNSAMSAVSNLNNTASTIKFTFEDPKGLLGDAKLAVGDLRDAITEARSTLSQARLTVADINEGKGSLGKLLKDETLYNETTLAMTNLREVLQKINQGQGTVGKLVNDESFLKNAKMTLQKLDKATEGLEDQGPMSVLGIFANGLF